MVTQAAVRRALVGATLLAALAAGFAAGLTLLDGDRSSGTWFDPSPGGPRADRAEPGAVGLPGGDLDTATRKRRFVALVLPLIAAENAAILADRQTVLALAERLAGGRLGPVARARLERIKRDYGVTDDDVALLLRRVDAVPPSLALAQAAIESGWGGSRFAREANALFGQRTWTIDLGLVPEAEAADADFAVRAFDDLGDSVRAYMRNLNRHGAYAAFRADRQALRAAGRPLDGARLAEALAPYSEGGEDYVRLVRQVMRGNRFGALDLGATAQFIDPTAARTERMIQGPS